MRRLHHMIDRFRRNDDGVAAIEFALISTVFLAFLAGICAIGLYMLTWNRLQYGTEMAARHAAVHEDASVNDLEDIITESLSLVTSQTDTLVVSTDETTSNGITFTEVTASYPLDWNFPFIPEELSNLTLQTTSRMAVE